MNFFRNPYVIGGFVAFTLLVVRQKANAEPTSYSDKIQTTFVAGCTRGGQGGPDIAKQCECMYETIRQTIPFEQFVEFDRDYRATPNMAPPQWLITIARSCQG
jgi:hypothetical protein